jgi:hypothetical protein
MAEMLLINPRRRRRAAKASARRSPARRVTAHKRRRRNPIAPTAVVRHAMRRVTRRKSNPHRRAHHVARRRRNPIRIGMGNKLTVNSITAMFKDAAIGGAGAIGMDVIMGQLNKWLPVSLQTNPNAVGIGDAVKAVATAVIGQGLNRMTKGLSKKAAQGALICQARDIMSGFLPSTMTIGGLGYGVPGAVVGLNNRIGPNRGLRAYLPTGATPLLSAYLPKGQGMTLSGPGYVSAATREGVKYR